jgi:hypothetical protein
LRTQRQKINSLCSHPLPTRDDEKAAAAHRGIFLGMRKKFAPRMPPKMSQTAAFFFWLALQLKKRKHARGLALRQKPRRINIFQSARRMGCKFSHISSGNRSRGSELQIFNSPCLGEFSPFLILGERRPAHWRRALDPGTLKKSPPHTQMIDNYTILHRDPR